VGRVPVIRFEVFFGIEAADKGQLIAGLAGVVRLADLPVAYDVDLVREGQQHLPGLLHGLGVGYPEQYDVFYHALSPFILALS